MMSAKPNTTVTVGTAKFGNTLPLAVIVGPCALESRAHALEMAEALKEITGKLGLGFVYKTSFDKANRSSAASARGLGLDKALTIFADLRDKLGVAVLTDVHSCCSSGTGRRASRTALRLAGSASDIASAMPDKVGN